MKPDVVLPFSKNTDSASTTTRITLPGGDSVPLSRSMSEYFENAKNYSGIKVAYSNEKLKNLTDNEEEGDMKSSFYNNHTLFWTIVSGVVGAVAVLGTMMSMSVQTTQSIRDEMQAQNMALLTEIKSELRANHEEISSLRNEIDHKIEIQDLKTENSLLREKTDKHQ